MSDNLTGRRGLPLLGTSIESGRFVVVPKSLVRMRSLTSGGLRVWAVLAERANADRVAWPGIRRIASDTGLSLNAVLRGIENLIALGLLEVVRPGRLHRPATNRYRLTDAWRTVVETASSPKRQRRRNGYSTVAETDTEQSPLNNPKRGGDAWRRRAPRKPDPLFDAFAAALGFTPATDDERGKWNRGLKALRDAAVDPAEVGELVRAYRQRFGQDIPCHPVTLSNKLGELRNGARREPALTLLGGDR